LATRVAIGPRMVIARYAECVILGRFLT